MVILMMMVNVDELEMESQTMAIGMDMDLLEKIGLMDMMMMVMGVLMKITFLLME